MTTILVIDDNADVRALVRRPLEQAGHRILEAENGSIALAALAREPVDLIITDIFMPDMDGIETIRTMRASHPALPIVAMSGAQAGIPEMDYLRAAETFGANRALRKPFTRAQLMAAVQACLAAR